LEPDKKAGVLSIEIPTKSVDPPIINKLSVIISIFQFFNFNPESKKNNPNYFIQLLEI
jgi:hypothetical protein